MAIFIKLSIPNKIVPKIRVHPCQSITIFNRLSFFSSNNKMLFISKGIIHSYKKSIEKCNLFDGDTLYALNINENNLILENILLTTDDININLLKNHIPIFGPCNEVNLTSIYRIISKSQNPDDIIKKIVINDFLSLRFLAQLKDIKSMKRENNRLIWLRQKKNFLRNESNNDGFFKLPKVEYVPPKEPCCDALPIF